MQRNTIPKRIQQKRTRSFSARRHGLIGLAVVAFMVAGYVGADIWFTNKRTQAVVTELSSEDGSDENATWTKDDEGRDEHKVTAESLANYTVGATLPRALYIDKLNIAARIMPMSVHADGSVQAPRNIYDAGWYNGSVKPGEIGAAFIDGHASGATREGLFAYLDTLIEGDTLQVEKGSGEKLTFRVVHVEKVALEGIDMKKVLLPYGNTLRGLNLMTCTGKWVQDKDTYDHRVVVYTALVE